MKTFKPVDTFDVLGRGVVHTGPTPFTERENARRQVGTVVLMSGKPYRIVGVEAFATISPPGLGDPIGLLLEPEAQ